MLPARLAGMQILVVEDEPLVALDIVAALEAAGAEVLGTAGTAKEALTLINNTEPAAALLDGNLRGQSVDEIAAALTARNVPFLFVTGYGAESLPQAFAKAPILSKPFSHDQLIAAAASNSASNPLTLSALPSWSANTPPNTMPIPIVTLADGLFWLHQSVQRNSMVRKIEIMKMRGAGASCRACTRFASATSGITIFPPALQAGGTEPGETIEAAVRRRG